MARKSLIITLILLSLVVPSAAWWDTDYLYRQEITISNPPSVSDFQAPFTITYNAHMDADFADIRFVDDDDSTPLDYWIEDYTASTSATGYVELADTGSTIYLYYGKDEAASASDGDATFGFFDDFPGSSLDGDKWTTDAGSPTVSGGILTINSGEKITGKTVFGGNYIVEYYAQLTEGGTSSLISIGFGDYYDTNSATIIRYKGDTNTRCFSKSTTSTEGDTIGSWGSQYYYFSTSRVSTTDIIHTRDPGTSSTISTNVPTINLAPRVCSRTTYGGTAEVDWLLVRKYTATEPSFAYGSEEEQTSPPVAAFSGDPLSGIGPLTVTFTDASTNTPTSWCWDIDNDGDCDYATQNCSHTYTSQGLYTVNLTVSNGDGSDSEVKSNYINVTGVLITFPGCSSEPTDPNADTLYEDINGNGRWDFNDIIVYFQNLAWCEANQPVALFDWNSNSRCDYDDVYELWQEEGIP